ncbi:MAG: disulfide bond formation protein B [Cocleimonas sp.]
MTLQSNSSQLKSIRFGLLIGFFTTVAMMGIAFFFQYYLGLEPCPLCSVQRVAVIALGLIFLIALIHNPNMLGRRIYGFLLTLASIAGLLIAGRHTWLQHLPKDKIPECGPGLDFWMKNLPSNEVIKKIFEGSGECAEVVFSLMGLSIPEWSLIAFLLFLLYSLRLLFLAR